MNDATLQLILRIGQGAIDLAIAIARAIDKGDVSVVDELAKQLDESDAILARAEALKTQKRKEAQEHFLRELPEEMTFERLLVSQGISPWKVRMLRELSKLPEHEPLRLSEEQRAILDDETDL